MWDTAANNFINRFFPFKKNTFNVLFVHFKRYELHLNVNWIFLNPLHLFKAHEMTTTILLEFYWTIMETKVNKKRTLSFFLDFRLYKVCPLLWMIVFSSSKHQSKSFFFNIYFSKIYLIKGVAVRVSTKKPV